MQLQKGEIESKTAKLKKMCGPKKAMVKKMTVAAKKWLWWQVNIKNFNCNNASEFGAKSQWSIEKATHSPELLLSKILPFIIPFLQLAATFLISHLFSPWLSQGSHNFYSLAALDMKIIFYEGINDDFLK